jgi:hypothetical protein
LIKVGAGGVYPSRAYLTLRPHILHDESEFEDRFRIHGLKETYPVVFQDGVDSYQVTIQFHPTVAASGTVSSADLTQVRDVLLSCSRAKAAVAADGHFDLRGVIQNEGGVLYVLNKVTGILTRRVVSTVDAAADVAVGVLAEQAADDTGRLKLKLNGLVPEVPDDSSERVVLVSTTGARMYQFKVNPAGQVQAWNRTDDEVRLAPGEYFVFPGSIPSVFAEKMVRLILANRAADLTTAQIPKVVVTTDEPVATEIERSPVWGRVEQVVE